jgi:hypothetical protein
MALSLRGSFCLGCAAVAVVAGFGLFITVVAVQVSSNKSVAESPRSLHCIAVSPFHSSTPQDLLCSDSPVDGVDFSVVSLDRAPY